jgi:hypothetical protein
MFKYWSIHFSKIWNKKIGVYSFYLLPSVSYYKDEIFEDEEFFSIKLEWLIWCLYIRNCVNKPIKIRKR